MPRFEPFSGLRYNSANILMDDVISPPYDIVGAKEAEILRSRSPYNSILIELPIPDQSRHLDAYQFAAVTLTEWIEKGVLISDDQKCFYGYRMIQPSGESTIGVIGALSVTSEDRSAIFPHEQTMPKPKGDRLELLRTCKANLSPIWGLSLSQGLTAELKEVDPPISQAKDDSGTIHQLWKITEEDRLSRISKLVASAPIVLADGHHRYETAIAYAEEQRNRFGGAGGDYDFVMALIVELAEDQLTIRPIHRVLSNMPNGFDVTSVFREYFKLERISEPVDLDRWTTEPPSPTATSNQMLLYTKINEWWEMTPSLQLSTEVELPRVDSALLEPPLAALPAHELSYIHDPQEAIALVSNGQADAAVQLQPVSVEQIAEAGREGMRMPPKTTFFYPKPRTGMVFRLLDI